jgi:hypothetical protein
MADVKLPNISQTNLNLAGQGVNQIDNQYADQMSQPRADGRSQSFHSGRPGGSGNGFGQVGRSIMEAKKQRKE